MLGHGRTASAAVPELVGILKEDQTYLHYWAAKALVRMGPVGVAGLVQVGGPQGVGLEISRDPGEPARPGRQVFAPTLGRVLQERMSPPEQESLVAALENIGIDAVPTLAALARTPGGSGAPWLLCAGRWPKAARRAGAGGGFAAPSRSRSPHRRPPLWSPWGSGRAGVAGGLARPDATAGNAAIAVDQLSAAAKEAVPDLAGASLSIRRSRCARCCSSP